MSEVHIKLLNRPPCKSFDCGNDSINKLVINDSYFSKITQFAYTWEITCEGKVLGYCMVKMKSIYLDECPDDISDYSSDIIDRYSAVEIKFLAIDKRYQGKHIGTYTLAHMIRKIEKMSTEWPIRLIHIDALKDKAHIYEKIGFQYYNRNDFNNDDPTIRMYRDCITAVNFNALEQFAGEQL